MSYKCHLDSSSISMELKNSILFQNSRTCLLTHQCLWVCEPHHTTWTIHNFFSWESPCLCLLSCLKKHAMYTMVTRTVSWEHVSERQCQLRMNLILLRTLMIPSPDLTIQGVTKKPNNFISNGMAKIYTG